MVVMKSCSSMGVRSDMKWNPAPLLPFALLAVAAPAVYAEAKIFMSVEQAQKNVQWPSAAPIECKIRLVAVELCLAPMLRYEFGMRALCRLRQSSQPSIRHSLR